MPPKSKIGKNLRKARLKRGITQAEVAKAADLHTNYYASVQRDEENLSIKTFKKIFELLKVKSSDILDF